MSRVRADVALLGVAVMWGSSYLAAKTLLASETVFPILALRFGIAATVLAVVLTPRCRRLTRSELAAGLMLGAVLATVLILETLGVVRTSASNAGLIIATTVVLTPLLDRRVQGSFYAAAGVALAGVAVMTGTGISRPNVGDVLILLAAVARAVHVTLMARLSAGRDLDPGRVTLIQLLMAGGVFVVLADSGEVLTVARALSLGEWLLMTYLAVGCTVLAFVVQLWAVRETSPSTVALLLGTEPVWAVVTGVAVAGDAVTAAGVAGAVLIVVGTNWARHIGSRTTSAEPLGG